MCGYIDDSFVKSSCKWSTKNRKLNGSSTSATVDAEMTLVQTHEDILPVHPLRLGTKFKLETSHQEALQ